MITPAHHGNSPSQIARYKVEPYVVAADVYTNTQHAGRGGWTWYTGSAGWMYRLIVESLLGIRLEGESLHIAPRLPTTWTTMAVHYRHHNTLHHIHVLAHPGSSVVTRVVCDGVVQADVRIALRRDEQDHHIEVHIGNA
jgi:cellobiose phosphorylase